MGGAGYHFPSSGRGYHLSRSRQGGRGIPFPGPGREGWGYPQPPIQVRSQGGGSRVGVPLSRSRGQQGYPLSRSDPSGGVGGYPLPRSRCYPPSLCPGQIPGWGEMGAGGMGVPLSRSRQGWGYPLSRSDPRMVGQAIAPFQVQVGVGGQGYHPHPGQIPGHGGTPYWNSIACTCYVVGSMHLAFTQEDFLVIYCVDGGGIVPWPKPPSMLADMFLSMWIEKAQPPC